MPSLNYAKNDKTFEALHTALAHDFNNLLHEGTKVPAHIWNVLFI